MKRKKSIVYLKRNQLEPHPQNPRKDLGDLEELRESIRQNGIMQNLTVIPTDDSFEHFRILIEMKKNKLKPPRFEGPCQAKITFGFKARRKKDIGKLKDTKPDCDNCRMFWPI